MTAELAAASRAHRSIDRHGPPTAACRGRRRHSTIRGIQHEGAPDSIALLAALAAGNAYAACTYPTPPDSLPDGATATREQMLEGKKKVTEFDQAIGAYTTCLQAGNRRRVAKIAPI